MLGWIRRNKGKGQDDPGGAAKGLQKRIGYTFTDTQLLEVALTHPSTTHTQRERHENNQRMEFLGDAVLDLILAEELYRLYPEEREGFLGQCRSSLARGATLAQVARKLRIQDALLLSPAEERNNGRDKDSNLEDALESIIGAIYLDSGYDAARKVILKWFSKHLRNLEIKVATDNPKGNLQEAVQAAGTERVEYRVLDVSGPDHKKEFKVAVFIGGKRKGTGTGNSKKKAEEVAAVKALKKIQ